MKNATKGGMRVTSPIGILCSATAAVYALFWIGLTGAPVPFIGIHRPLPKLYGLRTNSNSRKDFSWPTQTT